MDIGSLKLVYFSPTKTTEKILQNIAAGMEIGDIERYDLTTAEIKHTEITSGLVIIGAPVYSGRLPAKAVHRFQQLRANNIPAVVVVLYGNRKYEDALLELRNLTEELGFKPIAGGAFIGEHSFSNTVMPIAEGRPDSVDVKLAQEFGEKIQCLLDDIDSTNNLSPLELPGNIPYKELTESSSPLVMWKIAPYTDMELCTKCGICLNVCPTDSITLNETIQTNPNTCIRCCACIKYCPPHARYFTDLGTKRITEWLFKNYSQRKEPELYISSEI